MTGWFFANLAWASALMIAVLIVRRPFARIFGAGPAYALWLLPALRVVLPPLPVWPAAVSAGIPVPTLIVWAPDAAAPMPPDGGPGQWVPILLALWAVGAAALLGWQWRAYRRFLTRLSLSARSLGAHDGLPVIESGAVTGPLALGLIDRRIVVPPDFATRYSDEERRLALAHEAVHHRRGDLWWNHAALVMLALNWFNPVAWIAFRAFRIDQELACDAVVTAAATPQARRDYAQALIKSASRPGLIAACPLNHADQLKRRLRMMKEHRRSRLRMLGGAAALAVLAGAGGLTAATSVAAQADAPKQTETSRERRVERVIIRDHRDGEERSTWTERSGPPPADGEGRTERRQLVIVTDGHGGETADERGIRIDGDRIELPADCDAGNATNVEEGTDRERTRIMVCSRGDSTPAERAANLQRARDRLAGNTELSGEARDRTLAALDREIARLRAQ